MISWELTVETPTRLLTQGLRYATWHTLADSARPKSSHPLEAAGTRFPLADTRCLFGPPGPSLTLPQHLHKSAHQAQRSELAE